jgi:hypothetical protein
MITQDVLSAIAKRFVVKDWAKIKKLVLRRFDADAAPGLGVPAAPVLQLAGTSPIGLKHL